MNTQHVKPRLYVGCSLAHAPAAFLVSIEKLKERLSEEFEVMEFIGKVKGTARDVYQWDIHTCVAGCDYFLAICDHPSLGLGYELGVAIEKLKKPTLAIAHKDTPISRLIVGIDAPQFAFMTYGDLLQDAPVLLTDHVKRFS